MDTEEYIEKSVLALVGVTALAILITILFAPTPQAQVQAPPQVQAQVPPKKKDIYSNKTTTSTTTVEGFVSDPKLGFSVQPHVQEGFGSGFGSESRSAPLQEGLKSIEDTFKDAFEKPFNDMGDQMKGAFSKVGDDITNKLGGPLKEITDFFNKLKNFFETIPGRINNFIGAFRDVNDGINLEFVNLGKSLDLGLTDVANVVGTATTCGINMIKNFRNCILYYLLDWIGKVWFGIFVEFPVFIINVASGGSFDARKCVDMVIDMFQQLDDGLHKSAGFRFMHFPDSVIQMCYYCNFDKEIAKLKHDWNDTIPVMLNEPAQKFIDAKYKFEDVFKS